MFKAFTLTLLLTAPAFAQETILIQAPGASPMEFAESAKDKTAITWLNLQIQRAKNNPRQEERVLALSEILEKSPKDIVAAVDALQSEGPLTETSLQFLHDLSEKIQARSLAPAQIQYFKDLSCKTAGLTSETGAVSCSNVRVDMQTLRRQWPLTTVVMIEGKDFSIEDSSPEIYPRSAYHWTLLSNSQKPVKFYGTYEQLLQQRFATENLVDGTCGGFSSNIDDFELSSRAVIFFSKGCMKALNQPKEQSSFAVWFDNNKTWVYPVGAILLGGALIGASGKTLVIDKP